MAIREADKKTAIAAVKKGKSLAFAAALTGVSEALVCRWVKEAGLLPGRKQRTQKMCELIQEGALSVQEIAEAVGITKVSVYAWRKRLNAGVRLVKGSC